METEDFTFPISDPTNSPIDSPPLWNLSPATSPTPSYSQQIVTTKLLDFHTKQTENTSNAHHVIISSPQRKSCSCIEGGSFLKRLRMGGGQEDDDDDRDLEEKMDMLWEDLNEEVSWNHRDSSRMINYSRGGQNKLIEFGCVPTSFRLVKGTKCDHNKSVVKNIGSYKKPSMVALMNVFRKLFLLHRSQQSCSQKRSW